MNHSLQDLMCKQALPSSIPNWLILICTGKTINQFIAKKKMKNQPLLKKKTLIFLFPMWLAHWFCQWVWVIVENCDIYTPSGLWKQLASGRRLGQLSKEIQYIQDMHGTISWPMKLRFFALLLLTFHLCNWRTKPVSWNANFNVVWTEKYKLWGVCSEPIYYCHFFKSHNNKIYWDCVYRKMWRAFCIIFLSEA